MSNGLLGQELYSHGFTSVWSHDGTGRNGRLSKFRPNHLPKQKEGLLDLEIYLLRYGGEYRSVDDWTRDLGYGVSEAVYGAGAKDIFNRFNPEIGALDLNGERPFSLYPSESKLAVLAAMQDAQKDGPMGGWFFTTFGKDFSQVVFDDLDVADFVGVYIGEAGRNHQWWKQYGVKHGEQNPVDPPHPQYVATGIPRAIARYKPFNYGKAATYLLIPGNIKEWVDWTLTYAVPPVRAEIARSDYTFDGDSPNGLFFTVPAQILLPMIRLYDRMGRPEDEKAVDALVPQGGE